MIGKEGIEEFKWKWAILALGGADLEILRYHSVIEGDFPYFLIIYQSVSITNLPGKFFSKIFHSFWILLAQFFVRCSKIRFIVYS
jgi:hypothetical protein